MSTAAGCVLLVLIISILGVLFADVSCSNIVTRWTVYIPARVAASYPGHRLKWLTHADLWEKLVSADINEASLSKRMSNSFINTATTAALVSVISFLLLQV